MHRLTRCVHLVCAAAVIAASTPASAQTARASATPDAVLAEYRDAVTARDWQRVTAVMSAAELDAYRDRFISSAIAPERIVRLFGLRPGENLRDLSGQQALARLLDHLEGRGMEPLVGTIRDCTYELESVIDSASVAYSCRRPAPDSTQVPPSPAVTPQAVQLVRGAGPEWRVVLPAYLHGLQAGLLRPPPGVIHLQGAAPDVR